MTNHRLTKWEWALRIAAPLAASFAALTVPPPSSSLVGSLLDWPQIAVFVLALLILVGSGFFARRVGQEYGVVLFILGIACLIGYFFALQEWSCSLEQGRVVIGDRLLPAAAEYLSDNPNSNCFDLLVSFASDPLRVYESQWIELHEAIIGIIYVVMIALLSVGVLSVVGGKQAS